MQKIAKKTKTTNPSGIKSDTYRSLILMGVFVMASCVCGADFRCFDDFEDDIMGLIGGQDGWLSSGGDNRIVEDPENPGSLSLYVPSESSILRKSLLLENVGIPDAAVRMMFMRLRVSKKQTFSVGVSHLKYPSEFSDFAPEIGMANSAQNLDLRVWDDDGGNYETLTQLAPDRWYNMWVCIDAAQNNYQIWLNDVPGADADAADKLTAENTDDTFDFRSGQNSGLFTFYIKTAGGSSGTNFGPVYIDDIYFELSNTLNLSNPIGIVPPIPGDANVDGCVNLVDFDMMAAHWGSGPTPPAVWADGNFDYDDAVNLGDLYLFATHWLMGTVAE